MKLTVKAGGVPAGSHIAKFLSVEEKAGYQNKPGLLWTWEVVNGPHAGCKATGFTDTVPTIGNKCGRFLQGLMGKPLQVNTEIDPQAFVGKLYMVLVKDNQNGKGTGVTEVTAPPV